MNYLRLLKPTALAACMLVAGYADAQMTGGSVFLKGKYVEAGICANGDFGAASPPAGYHPHTFSPFGGPLGFVADPAMDGWAVGTPAYTGDYFTPGSPFEGWNLQIGSIRAQAHSCAGFTGTGLTGANVSYTTSGSKVIGTWEGSFDSMTVRQVTTLDTLALYFTMKVTLINTASVAKNNIYYMRSLDPDNDQSWTGGSFVTLNKIEYQLPNTSNATVVSAKGTFNPLAYLSLGTADTNAKCLIYNAWPIVSSTDLSTIYSGAFTGTYTAGATTTMDAAIGIAFRVAHIAPVDSASDSVSYKTTEAIGPKSHPANQASFSYFYAFSPAATDSALQYIRNDTTVYSTIVTPPPPPPTAINNINAGKDIKVYPNPTMDVLNVTGIGSADQLALYDMMGKQISTGWIIADQDVNSLPVNKIPAGNYVLIVTDASGKTRAHVPVRKQ